jgi:hypothetical protein
MTEQLPTAGTTGMEYIFIKDWYGEIVTEIAILSEIIWGAPLRKILSRCAAQLEWIQK